MYTLFSIEPIEFVPEKYKNDSNPLTFYYRPPSKSLTLRTQALLASVGLDNQRADDETLSKLMNMTLSECVVGWKNVVDDKGNPVEFTKDNFERFNDSEVLIDLYSTIQAELAGSEKN